MQKMFEQSCQLKFYLRLKYLLKCNAAFLGEAKQVQCIRFKFFLAELPYFKIKRLIYAQNLPSRVYA